ncbi:hypothetical protein H311_00602, partial [Anncaliia algerae PRA109]
MKLITHSGTFHCDDVLSTAMLKLIYPTAEVIRTRDEEIIKTGDIVYDVGRIYDVKTNRYDHHQRGFTKTFSDKYTNLCSSAGLVYMEFHEQLFLIFNLKKDNEFYERIYNEVYEEYFLGVDSVDNGVIHTSNYRIRSICEVVSSFNIYDDEEKQSKRFLQAVELITMDLSNYLTNKIYFYLNDVTNLINLIKKSDNILVSDYWVDKNDVVVYEKECNKDIKYIVLNKENKRIYAVPVSKGSFESKVPLKKEWRGLAGEELRKVS